MKNYDKYDTTPGTSAVNQSGCLQTTNQERYYYTSFPATKQRRIILKGNKLKLSLYRSGQDQRVPGG